MLKERQFKKIICLFLAVVFLCGQAFAFGPSLGSDDINPARQTAVQDQVADAAKPGAIGNGELLRALLRGEIPPEVELEGAMYNKVRDAAQLALALAILNSDHLSGKHGDKNEAAITAIRQFITDVRAGLYPFSALIDAPEDYLLGFPADRYSQGRTGLSVELIKKLPVRLLAQYIYHEFLPERTIVLENLELDRTDHQENYKVIATAIFGAKDVAALKKELRGLIARTLWPRPEDVTPDKRVVMLISGGEAPGVNNYFSLLATKLARHGYSLELVRDGLKGLVKTKKKDFDEARLWVGPEAAEEMIDMPGAYAGSARVSLNESNIEHAINNLRGYCKTALVVGGNDHIKQGALLGTECHNKGEDILVLVLPKTIDGDTLVYPIGACTAGENLHKMALRAAPMPGSGECVIFQVMGRDCGFLTVAAGDMRPEDLSVYSPADIAKMKEIAPTVVMAVPEASAAHGVTFADLVNAIKARMKKYGAATAAVSEGFRIAHNDPLLISVLRNNKLLKYRHAAICGVAYNAVKNDDGWTLTSLVDPSDVMRVGQDAAVIVNDDGYVVIGGKYDSHGNPALSELGIADFVAEALDMDGEIDLKIGENLYVEDTGYSIRGTGPNPVDAAVADAATTIAAGLVLETPDWVKKEGGACIAGDSNRAGAGDAAASVRAMPFEEAVGTTNLDTNGVYSTERLAAMPILGKGIKKEETLPEISAGRMVAQAGPADFNKAMASFGSQAELMLGMKRPNICVVARSDADELVGLFKEVIAGDRELNSAIDRSARYAFDRTRPALLAFNSEDDLSLAEIIAKAVAVYNEKKMVSLTLPAGFKVHKDDPILKEINDNTGGALDDIIKKITPDQNGDLVFGRRLVDVLYFALTAEGVTGIRKNVLGESLNRAPKDAGTLAVNPVKPLGESTAEELVARPVTGQDIDEVARRVKDLRETTGIHAAEAGIDLSGYAVIMKRDLVEGALAKTGSNTVDNVLRERYQVLEQDLRRMFPGEKGVVEVANREELAAAMFGLINSGKKVILLDDGTLTKDFDPARAIPGNTVGNPGEHYCAVSLDMIKNMDLGALPVINLRAMAGMGVGILEKDMVLFRLAYEAFTGKKAPEALVDDLRNNILWLIRELPLIIRWTDEMDDMPRIKKLLESMA